MTENAGEESRKPDAQDFGKEYTREDLLSLCEG